MGWVWRDDNDGTTSGGEDLNPRSLTDHCSTKKIVKCHCGTEEVEPGKFIKKCEKTEEILKICAGRPSEVVQSNKEYTEEDVTEQVVKGSFPLGSPDVGPFGFPGLRSDIEGIESNIFSGMSHFFEAVEEMKAGFLSAFEVPRIDDRDSKSTRRRIPIESDPPKEARPKPDNRDGQIDLSGLAKDV